MQRHPKQRLDQVWSKEQMRQPFESENAFSELAGSTLEQQRRDRLHGGVSVDRDATDNAVRNTNPFRR